MSPESETAATLRPPGPPRRGVTDVSLPYSLLSVCASPVFCKAQTGNTEDSAFSASFDVF